ncbi:hypothetical protein [Sinorhizobium fredii]
MTMDEDDLVRLDRLIADLLALRDRMASAAEPDQEAFCGWDK